MEPAGIITALAVCIAAATNLLSNPGFERRSGDLPSAWHRFVEAQPGAIGRLDEEAHGGDFAALLHTPLPYAKEPINNWSQNVYAELAGKECEARAFIRTVDAGQAALWVQCWRKGARLPHATFTSHEEHPVQGSRPWGEVAFQFTVPPGTDFVTLRCVLIGTGSAWFDDVYLAEAAGEDEQDEEEKKKKKKKTAAEEEAKEEAAPVTRRELDALREEMEKLKKAHYVLAGAVEELRRALRERDAQERPRRRNRRGESDDGGTP